MSDTQGNVTAPTVMHQPTLLGGAENMKLLFDEELDSRRETLARQRAWEDLSLRRAQNAATIDHAINAGLILQGQVGATESAQTVSPVSRGEGDSATAQAYTPNRTVDVAAAGVATANQAIADQLAAMIAAITATIVAASGNAANTSTK